MPPYRNKPPENKYVTELPNDVIDFDVNAFDDLIRGKGVRFVHWRAMRCPVGLGGLYDTRQSHSDHSGCSNGFLYRTSGALTCLFVGNNKDSEQKDTGLIDGSTVTVTMPRFYESGEPVYVAPFDRFYLDAEYIVVVHWEMAEYNNLPVQRLKFPIEKVHDLIDNQGKEYKLGVDFELVDGKLKWTGSHPAWDGDAKQGAPFVCRYLYRPYWYCARVLHEVRLTQVDNPTTGNRDAVRMPHEVQLQREHVFESANNDPESKLPDNPRQAFGPGDGQTGPR